MKKGFTLVELLMVMVLIAVLAAVALPKYRLSVERGRAVEGVSNICWVAQYLAVQNDLGNTVNVATAMSNSDLKWNYFTKDSAGALKACRGNGWDYCIEGDAILGTATCVGTDCDPVGLEGTLCEYDKGL